MISVELIEILYDDNELAFDDNFLREIPNYCLIKFLETRDWELVKSNQKDTITIFYSIANNHKRVIIPNKDKLWVDNAVRWRHNIKVLTEHYDITRYDLIRAILEE